MFKSSISTIFALVVVMMFAALVFQEPATATPFRTTDQVLNLTLDQESEALKTVPGCNTTVFKKVTLSPQAESTLTFSQRVRRWSFMNMAGTCPVYINFDAPATLETSFKVPAGNTLNFDSGVTSIHAIAGDTIEVQAVGGY